jgi:hypothetical protein
VELTVLTEDGLVERLSRRYARPGLSIEGMRLEQAKRYEQCRMSSGGWGFCAG